MRDEVRPLFWKSPVQSVSGYHPSWVKQVVSVRGTVSRFDEKPSMFTTAVGCAVCPSVARLTNGLPLSSNPPLPAFLATSGRGIGVSAIA